MTAGPVILVTGGAGFIGSHTCKALARAGCIPVTLDNLSTGHRGAVRWGPFEQGDVRDSERVLEVLRRYRIRRVIHFAASAYVGESVVRPDLYYDNNVVAMSRLLGACLRAGVDQIIFSSSCATYGIPPSQPISEDTPQNPINPYGRTKLICEQMLHDYAAAYGMRHVCLRYFNACGADPEGELAERHDPETHLIPLALLAAAGRRPRLEVFGNDYDTPDGSCVRDYVHVSDLADGHVLALRYLDRGAPSLAVNLGSGTGHSIFQVLRMIEEIGGRPVPVTIGPRRAGDPDTLLADPELARRVLGFRARRSNLATIIRDAAPSFGVSVDYRLSA